MEHVVHALHCAPACFEPGDISPDETDATADRTQVLAATCRKVVQHGNLRAVAYEPLDEMRANESSAAGDEVSHARR